ncbi:MAG TPA: type II secretion system F family protein [Symbiobacteriaceae bacterium]|nr:type II secretion system F family protein [Symbiobacteriaceae bacterium]
MWMIGLMMLVAVSGGILAAYLMKREPVSRVRRIFQELEGQPIPLAEQERPAAKGLSRLGRLMPGAVMASYRERLLWAGRPGGLDAAQFLGLKLVGLVTLPLFVPLLSLFQLDSTSYLLIALLAPVGFLLPDMWLNGRLSERKRIVQEELPFVADLIATAVAAGLSLTEAVRRVAEDAGGLVAGEFLRTVQEMAAGKPRQQAWRDLIDRVPTDEFRTIVNAIMGAEQYGTSVAEILQYQVKQIRSVKQQEAQRIAQTVTVKMRVPMLILILLPFMVLLLGPALLQIAVLLD